MRNIPCTCSLHGARNKLLILRDKNQQQLAVVGFSCHHRPMSEAELLVAIVSLPHG